MDHEPSDAELLSHITTYDPPPPGFDPLTAPHHLLRKHGYPHRPDPDKEPRLSKLWRDSLSRPHKMIRAELQVDRSRARDGRLRPSQSSFGVTGWAGAQVNTSSLGFAATELANTVYGQWSTPRVSPPDPDTGFAVGFWVGMGGDYRNGSSQVVQAGTEALSDGKSVIYQAWTQWSPYQSHAVKVPNFPIAPGDHVAFLVMTPQPDHAFISMMNYNNGWATSVGITPPGARNDGTSAEWVIEGNGALLADFYSVIFGQCTGGTKEHDFDLTYAIVDQVLASDGVTVLASAGIVPPNGAVVFWNGSGP